MFFIHRLAAILGCIVIWLFLLATPSFANTQILSSYKLTDAFDTGYPPVPGASYKVLSFPFTYNEGRLVFSSNPDGTGEPIVGDYVFFEFFHFNGPGLVNFTRIDATTDCVHYAHLSPVDITINKFRGQFSVIFVVHDLCGHSNKISSLYLVNIKDSAPTPSPTPSPFPTPTPAGPAPFLDLPWDYQGKGLSFSDAALSINSFFDHEYPLLSSGLNEPQVSLGSLTNYEGKFRSSLSYSSHDGYDYGKAAQANFGDPVLAASAGWATFDNSCHNCGNMILIDHQNGYQTRYMHLQSTGLVVSTPGQKVFVNNKTQIGKVGATGNVIPPGEPGAHIHFMVAQDKNKDGNFDDNIPDGITDPFGWQSNTQDPWEQYSFSYNGNRTGNKSYYLWKNSIDAATSMLASNGGSFTTGKFSLQFPQGAVNQNLTITLEASPLAQASATLVSLGPTLSATAKDILGNLVTEFLSSFKLVVDLNQLDLTSVDSSTLSIYSSQDGINWSKENTIIDFSSRTAIANINHFSQFALMAQRRDTTPPTTTATLQGQQGNGNWFHSDVTFSLNASDNQNGLGVDYTLYREEGKEWEPYTKPLIYTNEGHYKIEFYSVDKDENIEPVQSVIFDIDKTPPEAELVYDLNTRSFELSGKDSSSSATISQSQIEREKQQFIISDQAGNTLTLLVIKTASSTRAYFSLYSLRYINQPVITIPKNKFIIELGGDKKVKTLFQLWEINDSIKIQLSYSSKTDKTRIVTTKIKQKTKEETKTGLTLLQLFTQNSTLMYRY